MRLKSSYQKAPSFFRVQLLAVFHTPLIFMARVLGPQSTSCSLCRISQLHSIMNLTVKSIKSDNSRLCSNTNKLKSRTQDLSWREPIAWLWKLFLQENTPNHPNLLALRVEPLQLRKEEASQRLAVVSISHPIIKNKKMGRSLKRKNSLLQILNPRKVSIWAKLILIICLEES